MTAPASMPLRDLFAFQATMRLDDPRNTPETARDIIIDWFVRKLQKATTDQDYSFPSTWAAQRVAGKEAAIESLVGVAPSGATFWAAQLEHKTPNRKWLKHYDAALAIPHHGQTMEISLRLSAQALTDMESDPASIQKLCTSVPFVVMDLAGNLTLQADGHTLGTQQNIDRNDPFAANTIAQLILSPHRTKPVILVSYAPKAVRDNYYLFNDLFRRTRGSAHVFICPALIMRQIEEKTGMSAPHPAGHLSLIPPQVCGKEALAAIQPQSYEKKITPTLPQQLYKDVARASLRAPSLDDIAPYFSTIKSVITPCEAMAQSAEGNVVPAASRFTDLARLRPDTQVVQPTPSLSRHKNGVPRV